MTRVVLLASVALSGCVVVLGPDRDAIVRDRPDGGDGGPDANDGGIDAPDACTRVPPGSPETDCNDGRDENCDGRIDCWDYSCRSQPVCCSPGQLVRTCVDSTSAFERLPLDAPNGIVFTDDPASPCDQVSSFGPPARTRALATFACQPVQFGLRYELQLSIAIECGTPPCDYAALSFAPVRRFPDEPNATSNAHFRAIVRANGDVLLERGGRELTSARMSAIPPSSERIKLTVDLTPANDGALLATVAVQLESRELARLDVAEPVAARDELVCQHDRQVGLYALIEGSGSGVRVHGELASAKLGCANPAIFEAQPTVRQTTAETTCPLGEVGAPALMSFCFDDCESPSPDVQWDLWLDATAERFGELHTEVPYGICGFARESSELFPQTNANDWQVRGSAAPLLPSTPSRREPTLLAREFPGNENGDAVQVLWFAYAERLGARLPEAYGIRLGTMVRGRGNQPSVGELYTDAECTSLRHPLLLGNWQLGSGRAPGVVSAWLLYTCERNDALPHIRRVEVTDPTRLPSGPSTVVLAPSPNDDTRLGIFAAEGLIEGQRDYQTARLWFLVHYGNSKAVIYADGQAELGSFPRLTLFPNNPVLRPDGPELGACEDCRLTGLAVARSFSPRNHYQLLVARARYDSDRPGIVHELVPLLQPTTAD